MSNLKETRVIICSSKKALEVINMLREVKEQQRKRLRETTHFDVTIIV